MKEFELKLERVRSDIDVLPEELTLLITKSAFNKLKHVQSHVDKYDWLSIEVNMREGMKLKDFDLPEELEPCYVKMTKKNFYFIFESRADSSQVIEYLMIVK